MSPRLLIAALAFVLGVSTVGLDWGLPYLWHTDEKVELAADMLARRSADPQYFVNPTVHIYLVTAAVWLAERIDRGEIQFQMRAIPPLTEPGHPDRAIQFLSHRLARGVSVVAAFLAVWCLYLTLRSALGEWAAACAALALAVSMGVMNVAHFATPEAVFMAEVVLAVSVFVDLAASGRAGASALAGLLFGLACSTKYTAIFLVAPLGCALGLVLVRRGWRVALGAASLAGVVSVGAFFAGTPYAAIHWKDFVAGGLEVTMRTGSPSGSLFTEPRSWIANARFMADAMSWPLFATAMVAVVAAVAIARRLTRPVRDVLFVNGVWAVALWAGLGLSSTSSMRFMVPVTPALAVFIGWGIDTIRRSGARPALRRAGLVAAALALAYAGVYTVVGVYAFTHDTRYAAGAWLRRHLDRGVDVSYFEVEAYVPFFDRPRYQVNFHPEVWPSRSHDADFTAWSRRFLAGLPDVIVDSDLFYPRFLGDPDRWPGRAEMYEGLFSGRDPSGYRLVASFEWHGLFGIHPTPELVSPQVVIFAKVGGIH